MGDLTIDQSKNVRNFKPETKIPKAQNPKESKSLKVIKTDTFFGKYGESVFRGIIVWILTLLFVCAVLSIGGMMNNKDNANTIAIPLLIAAMVPILVFAVLIGLGIFNVCTALSKEDKKEKEPLINKKKKKKSEYFDIV